MVNLTHPCREHGGELSRRAAIDALSAAVDWTYGGVSLARPRHEKRRAELAPSVGLCEALTDPIVEALMAADGTDREHVAALMRCVAARRMADRTIGKGASQ